jgi:branched-chain amino acid transport system permease protein
MRNLNGTALTRYGLVAVLVICAVAFPKVFPNPTVTNYGVYAMIYVTVASSWNLFSGNSGYIMLGQAVFYGSGAYALGLMASGWNVTGTTVFDLLPLVGLIGAGIALIFGLIALHVRRHTFIVITIAVFFIFQTMASNFGFTHGTQGLNSPFLSWSEQGFNTPFYYVALGLAIGTIAIAWLIRRSRFGLQLRAIRDDEDRARGLGVKTFRVKIAAMVISGAITAMIGGLWVFYFGQVQPQTGFDPLFDLTIVLMAFLGGYGTIAGPVLGALIVEPGQLWLNTLFTNGYISEIILGGIFLAVILLMPRGIIPTAGEWIKKVRTRGRPAVVTTVAVPVRGDDPLEPPAAPPRGDDPPEPPAAPPRGDDPPEPPATEKVGATQ